MNPSLPSPADLRPPSRREFLQRLTTGLVVLIVAGDLKTAESEAARPMRAQTKTPTDFNAFVRIGEDGRVTCFTGKIEMGQGAHTSIPQMLAEELDVPVERIDLVMGDTELCPFDQGTWGSMTTPFFGPLLRTAGAEARQVLLELGAAALAVPVAELATEEGAVFVRNSPSRRVTYGELTKGQRIERRVSAKAPLKPLKEYRVVGKPMLRLDARDKVTGKAQYTGDIRLPGMLYAAILRPPAHGAPLQSVDLSAARAIPGVVAVELPGLVAVLHELPDVAEEALTRVRATFGPSPSTLTHDTIFGHLEKASVAPRTVAQGGNVEAARATSHRVVQETYLNGYVAHAPMEPHVALARVEGDRVTLWASTQNPFGVREEVADALGFALENVRVITPFVGGAFGGKAANGQTVEAARLAQATRRPVQVSWTREEEFFNDTFRPAALVTIATGLDRSGKVTFWDYTVRFSGERGGLQFYSFPNHRTVAIGNFNGPPGVHPFGVGAWRAPGCHMNAFARESHVERLAALARMDPLEYRLSQLTQPRMIRVLKGVAEKFGWTPAVGPSGRGFGLACGEDAGSVVAMAAEVAVDRNTGVVTVKRIVCTQEMGQVVNPAGAILQMEGGIVMGLGYTFTEEVRFKNGALEDTNFDTYELPRFSDVPTIVCDILPADDIPPKGGGEPSITIVGAAISNAIFDATGAKLYRMPFTPERVKEALAAG